MTIHEHDRLPTGDDADRVTAHALVDRLSAGEPYAVAFGGQGASSWLANLEELVTMAGIESELARINTACDGDHDGHVCAVLHAFGSHADCAEDH